MAAMQNNGQVSKHEINYDSNKLNTESQLERTVKMVPEELNEEHSTCDISDTMISPKQESDPVCPEFLPVKTEPEMTDECNEEDQEYLIAIPEEVFVKEENESESESEYVESKTEPEDRITFEEDEIKNSPESSNSVYPLENESALEVPPDDQGETRELFQSTEVTRHQNLSFKSCAVCGKFFSNERDLASHMFIHRDGNFQLKATINSEDKPFSCTKCVKSFGSQKRLNRHLQIHMEKPYTCDMCLRYFYDEVELNAHRVIPCVAAGLYSCSKCHLTFKLRGSLRRHMVHHTKTSSGNKPYICAACAKSFISRRELLAHLKIHSGEKSFLCSECGKLYTSRGTLDRHVEKIHRGNRPFTCKECESCFFCNYQLKKHINSKHSRSCGNNVNVIKSFTCDLCGKCYASKFNLKLHMHSHIGVKAYSCIQCHKSFLTSQNLKVHVLKSHDETVP